MPAWTVAPLPGLQGRVGPRPRRGTLPLGRGTLQRVRQVARSGAKRRQEERGAAGGSGTRRKALDDRFYIRIPAPMYAAEVELRLFTNQMVGRWWLPGTKRKGRRTLASRAESSHDRCHREPGR